MHNHNKDNLSRQVKDDIRNADFHPYKYGLRGLLKDLFFLLLFSSTLIIYPNTVMKVLAIAGVVLAGLKCLGLAMAHDLGGLSHKNASDDLANLPQLEVSFKVMSLRIYILSAPVVLGIEVILAGFFAFYVALYALSLL